MGLGLELGLGLGVAGRDAACLPCEEEARAELGAVRLRLGGAQCGAVRGTRADAVERVGAEAIGVGTPAGDVCLVRVRGGVRARVRARVKLRVRVNLRSGSGDGVRVRLRSGSGDGVRVGLRPGSGWCVPPAAAAARPA